MTTPLKHLVRPRELAVVHLPFVNHAPLLLQSVSMIRALLQKGSDLSPQIFNIKEKSIFSIHIDNNQQDMFWGQFTPSSTIPNRNQWKPLIMDYVVSCNYRATENKEMKCSSAGAVYLIRRCNFVSFCCSSAKQIKKEKDYILLSSFYSGMGEITLLLQSKKKKNFFWMKPPGGPQIPSIWRSMPFRALKLTKYCLF